MSSDVDLAPLLERSLGGDEMAFAAVYDATAARAYGVSLNVLGDPVQAAEVVQEAYVQLWTHVAGFEPERGSAISWILQGVHQRAVRRRRSTVLMSGEVSGASTGAARAGCALADLSSTQRQAVELAYYTGHVHTEVEQLNGLPPGSAHLQMRDGLVLLADGRARAGLG